jgi:hypothetical protein
MKKMNVIARFKMTGLRTALRTLQLLYGKFFFGKRMVGSGIVVFGHRDLLTLPHKTSFCVSF